MSATGGPAALEWVGAMVIALATAYLLVGRDHGRRTAAMLLALALAPVLVFADSWDTERIADLRDDPVLLVAAAWAAFAAAAALAATLRKRPELLPLLLVAALPFRIPIELSGSDANLLLPLYLVIGGGALGAAPSLFEGRRDRPLGRDARLVLALLAASVVLYAIQSAYSSDFSTALNNIAFFFAPFAAAFVLLRRTAVERTARIALGIVVAEAVVFAAVGFGQLAAGELFWNEKVIDGNEAHSWFRVNSLFFDPNIYGRYLAVTMLGLAAVVAYALGARWKLVAGGLFVVLLGGLAISYSQSSLIALLIGLAVLSATRWRTRGAGAAALLALAGVVVGMLAGGPGSGEELSVGESLDTGGRGELVRTGLEIAADRPVQGYGSGSFEAEFRSREGAGPGISVASHTEPVTVAAEQGVIGLVVHAGLIVAALVMLGRPLRRRPPRAPALAEGELLRDHYRAAARAGLLAAFTAMVVHSFVYAAFLTDPITWTVLALGSLLARED